MYKKLGDEYGLRFEKETRQIIGYAMEVLNTLGHGLLEKQYENHRSQGWRGAKLQTFNLCLSVSSCGSNFPLTIEYAPLMVDANANS